MLATVCNSLNFLQAECHTLRMPYTCRMPYECHTTFKRMPYVWHSHCMAFSLYGILYGVRFKHVARLHLCLENAIPIQLRYLKQSSCHVITQLLGIFYQHPRQTFTELKNTVLDPKFKLERSCRPTFFLQVVLHLIFCLVSRSECANAGDLL